MIISAFLGAYYPVWYSYLVFETVSVLPLAALVAGASVGYRGTAGIVLRNGSVRYLGISYGNYLYHLFVMAAFYKFASIVGVAVPSRGLLLLAVGSASTVAVAAASWHFLERPLNSLKRYVAYGAGPGAGRGASVSPYDAALVKV